ncbi:MAG TPA: DUF4097 family beta strand repeat-containing protein [Pyrinomonadaceae bacterium]|nr:DUF4097 family beta strand repeat-containing protein [Pyrinomonadaceae bacterium]
MKFLFLIAILSLALAPAAARQTSTSARATASAQSFALERRADADPAVAVSLCISSGDVVVRGWDRREVRARAAERGALALDTAGQAPARRVEVLVNEAGEGELLPGHCGLTSGLELSVPRGASVNLRVHDGNVEVSDVAELTVNNLSGDVAARGVSRSVEAVTMSGDISLADSKGRARLRAVSGSVEATNVAPLAAGDSFEASSTSGDVSLSGVRHARVSGSTISGSVRASGPLARGGSYDFKTISGDVTLALPADASFRLNAKVVLSGEIITDFPIRATPVSPNGEGPPTPPAPPTGGPKPPRRVHSEEPQATRLVGTVGTGDAAVTLTSFSGTLHLKRQ